ncbi:MAG TPA: hypothetical protein VL099_08635 [Candidatus Binatia bacterium]|nr:hypothetical protein [Candidatus Binatia bacterium]
MLATGSHTVLVFVRLQFQDDWTRWSGVNQIGYTANAKSNQLLVVVEDTNAAKTTYFFNVGQGEDVWVERNVVHIPAICVKSAPGDEVKCRG